MELYPPLHLGVEAIEMGAFRSPSIKVTNFTFTYNCLLWIIINYLKPYNCVQPK